MIEVLCKYRWNDGVREKFQLEGTEDWVVVVELFGDSGGGYEWSEFKAFYSPAARRYFWFGDGGCSCNGWGDYLDLAMFENGSREDLTRAWRKFTEENKIDFTATHYFDGVQEIRKFEEPK